MGLGGISIWQLLIILVIVFAIFGTKKLRNIGNDLGVAIKGFKQGVKDEADENEATPPAPTESSARINTEEKSTESIQPSETTPQDRVTKTGQQKP